jgi:hypothetical protein
LHAILTFDAKFSLSHFSITTQLSLIAFTCPKMSIKLTPSLTGQLNAGKRRPVNPANWASQDPKVKKNAGQAHVSRSGKENAEKPPPLHVKSYKTFSIVLGQTFKNINNLC